MGKLYEFPHLEPSEEETDDSEAMLEPPFNLGVLIRSRDAALQRHPASHNWELAADTKPDSQNSDDTPPLA